MKPLRLNALCVLIFAFALTADISSPFAAAQSVSQPMPQTGAAVDAATRAEVIEGALKALNDEYLFPETAKQTEAGGEMIELPDTPAGKSLGEFIRAFNTGDLESLKRFHKERGGGYSTAEDLLKFTIALKNNNLLGADQTRRILQGGVGVAGGAPGINAALEMDRRSGYTVIVLSNYDPPSATDISQQIRKWIASVGE
jgi:hypothetical protein